MTAEPRHEADYGSRQVEAARRVLVDIGQVLAGFRDAIVVVGGWVPDLLISDPSTEHVGSIDVDLALDAAKLGDGRYADLLKVLLDSRRYERGDKSFQLVTMVDLGDDEAPVRVDVEFLAPDNVTLVKNRPKLVEEFRVLRFPACAAAFVHPEDIELTGLMTSGARNTVHLCVASLSDFIIMKAHALRGRDKPKDVYDICYCLDEYPDGLAVVAADWRARRDDPLVAAAIDILREKFKTVDHFGPRQMGVFHDATEDHHKAMHARRAFELVQALLQVLT